MILIYFSYAGQIKLHWKHPLSLMSSSYGLDYEKVAKLTFVSNRQHKLAKFNKLAL